MTSGAGGNGNDLPDRIGRYSVRSLVGLGGFAVVARVHDDRLDSDAAAKVLLRRFLDDHDVRDRFMQEARLLRRVDHRNVVTVFDSGDLPDGRPWFVMDYASGGVLEERMPGEGVGVQTSDLARVIDALEGGLGALHDAGVVHRDVKPGNLLIVGSPPADGDDAPAGSTSLRRTLLADFERLVVGDLGLASDQRQTRSGPTIMGGTPHFRAPEQTRLGADVGPGTDVYAATAVVWQLLTGSLPPLPGQVGAQLAGVPAPWQDFFARGLAERLVDRHPSMRAWAAAAPVRSRGSIDPGTAGAGTTGAVTTGTVTDADSAHSFVATTPGTACPFKGLAAFQPEDAPFFFGRSSLIDDLVARLRTHRTLVFGGPSGSGKSSLLRAGLLPAVSSGRLPGGQNWQVALFTPGSDALGELHRQLHRLTNGRCPSLAELRDNPLLARSVATEVGPALIAIDQFEELFTLADRPADRETFLQLLDALTSPADSSVRVAVALRADFYAAAAHHPWLAERINSSQLLVGPMSTAELTEAIVAPATRVGLHLEAGLAERIATEAGRDAGSLPLVAHALMETWLRREGDTMTLAGFQAAGGVAGAIAQTAEATHSGNSPDHQAATRRLMLRLVTPGDGAADTRNRVPLTDLPGDDATTSVIRQFTDARLLTATADSIEIAHERLIESWPRLRAWIGDARDELRLRQRIELQAAEWAAEGHHPDLVARGTPLATYTEWQANQEHRSLSERATRFLAASTEARDAQVAADEADRLRRQRVRRLAVAALTLLTVAAVTSSILAGVALSRSRSDEAEAQQQAASSIGTSASALADSDPLLALLLATESLASSDEPGFNARSGLIEARRMLAGEAGWVPLGAPIPVGDALDLAITPDGSTALVGDRDGRIVVVDTTTRTISHTLDGHARAVLDIIVDPTGRWAASADTQGAIRLWDLSSPDLVGHSFAEMGAPVWALAFSPRGDELAAVTEVGTIRRFETATGLQVGDAISVERTDLISAAMTDQLLLAGTGSGLLLVWDRSTGDLRHEIEAHGSDDVWEIVVDAAGDRAITTGTERAVRVWDLSTGTELAQAFTSSMSGGPIEQPGALLLAPDGRHLTAGDGLGRLHLWDLDTASPVAETAPRHLDILISADRSADGSRAVTLSDDLRMQVWQAGPFAPVIWPLATLPHAIDAVALSADGTHLAAAGEATVSALDTASGEVMSTYRLDNAEPTALAALGDSGGFAVADDGGSLATWVPGQDPANTITGPVIRSLAASSDGSILVARSDGLVRVLDGSSLDERTRFSILGSDPVAIDRDGTMIAVASGPRIHLVTVEGVSLAEPFALDRSNGTVAYSLAFSDDGSTLAVGTSNEEIGIWALADTPEKVTQLAPHSGGARSVAFAGDGQTVLGLSGIGQLRFWDRSSPQPLAPPVPTSDSAGLLAVGMSGRIYVADRTGTVTISDALAFDRACELATLVADERLQGQYLDGSAFTGC